TEERIARVVDVVAGLRDLQEGGESHEENDVSRGNLCRDSEDAVLAEDVREKAINRDAVVAQHARHPRADEAVDDENAGDNREGEPGHSPRNFEHEECADHAGDDVTRRKLSASPEEKAVELPPD